ncbi:polyhydroxyalkanoate synthesis regulator DNA-binding domain-containing protein [Streptomyces sp. NPDC008001]|uniref:polyhydroxyalkanoate synthesis regulator DNA-binding domain-containing protein n=1 Tax=Streptomyces sp. NPDC008001 TaxID=3364804 RepID=UPI0036ED8286
MRELTRHQDGSLYDTAAHRPVLFGELADDIRAGATFRARDAATDQDCTYQVLAAVLAGALSWLPAPFGRGGASSAAISALLAPKRS